MHATLMGGKLLHKTCLAACAVISLVLSFSVCADEGYTTEQQRRLFQEARRALHRGDLAGYRRVEPKLADYPLYPYLRYDYLRARLAQNSADEVHAFLAQFPDTPVATQLRQGWLTQLARRGEWPQFLADYERSAEDSELRCAYVNALIHTGDTARAWSETDALWMTAREQPGACNPVFEAWRAADQMTREKVLARIELAIDRKQTRLAARLADHLPRSDRPWVKRWQAAYRAPEAELKRLTPTADAFWSPRLFVYGVRRLAAQDARAADGYWAQRDDYYLSAEQMQRGERAVALNLAMQRHPDGYQRLATLAKSGGADRDARQWRVRSALWQQDWPQVLAALEGLVAEEQAQEDWQYWRGRALDALGRKEEAQVFFSLAAQHRSYYGFLASARLSRAPNIASEPLAVSDAELLAMENSPAMQRVRELTALEMHLEARREWRDSLSRMDAHNLRVAAKMAHAWGWHDQAILALGRTEYLNDLEVRFPLPYRDEVQNHAERRNLDPAFVFALMRQESAFGVHARSPVGALGLMQLMPATAKLTARSFRERAPSKAELLTADKNIRIGTAYLSTLLDKYRGNRFFALAAYNAGPQRVTRWQPAGEPMPADIWVANVTFAETREYIERILAYTAVYEWRLGRPITPVTDWLSDAPPRLIREANSEQNGRDTRG